MTLSLYAILLFGHASLIWGLHTRSRRAILGTLSSLCLLTCLILFTFDSPAPLLLTAFGPTAVSLFLWLGWIASHLSAPPLSHCPPCALRLIAFWYVIETFTLIDLSLPDTASLTSFYHPLAPLHIWTAVLARALLVITLSHAAFSHAVERHALRPAIFLQAIALFSGILWAQDAWLNAWHWDPIETLSLVTLISASALNRSQKPRWLCATAVALIATLCITNGAFGTDSQHSYGMDRPLALAFYAAFLATILYQYLRHPRPTATEAVSPFLLFLSHTAAFILILLALYTIFVSTAHTPWIAFLFCLLFILFSILHHKNYLFCILSICMAILLFFQPRLTTPSSLHTLTPLTVQTPAGAAALIDLDRTDNLAHAVIRLNQTAYALSFWDTQKHASSRAIAFQNDRLWRLSADAYTPSEGLTVRITDVTFFSIWLCLVMICSCIMLMPASPSARRPRRSIT